MNLSAASLILVSLVSAASRRGALSNQTNIISGAYFSAREPRNAAPRGILTTESRANIASSAPSKSKPRGSTPERERAKRKGATKRSSWNSDDASGCARSDFGFGRSGFYDDYLLGYGGDPFGSGLAFSERMAMETPYFASRVRSRKKRSVFHLYNMVLCATGCNPLSYKGYGCYCGFLGSGYVVDGIDSCCKMHDWCYNTSGCPAFSEYFTPYLWKCYPHRYPICAGDRGEFGGPGSCSRRLCECDRSLALCLKSYRCPGNKALCTSSPWRLLQNLLVI